MSQIQIENKPRKFCYKNIKTKFNLLEMVSFLHILSAFCGGVDSVMFISEESELSMLSLVISLFLY